MADEVVLEKMQDWVENDLEDAKFVYQCKLYTESILDSEDPKIVNMLFIQVRLSRLRVIHQFRVLLV